MLETILSNQLTPYAAVVGALVLAFLVVAYAFVLDKKEQKLFDETKNWHKKESEILDGARQEAQNVLKKTTEEAATILTQTQEFKGQLDAATKKALDEASGRYV